MTTTGRRPRQVDLNQTGSGTTGGAGQSVFSGGAGSAAGGVRDEQEARDELTRPRDAIVTTIAPDSWGGDHSGGRGRFATFRRSLLVYNTAEVHEQIAGAFALGQ